MKSERDFRTILVDLANDLVESAETRWGLLKEEMRERANVLKYATPLILVGAVFLITSFLLFTAAFVTFVAGSLPDSHYRWLFTSLIVLATGVLWAVIGLLMLYVAGTRIKEKVQTILPRKTLQVLKDDKARLQDAARNAA